MGVPGKHIINFKKKEQFKAQAAIVAGCKLQQKNKRLYREHSFHANPYFDQFTLL